MNTQGFLAQAHRRGQVTTTRNELRLHIDDRAGSGTMWSAIGACAFMLLVLFMVCSASRDPIRALTAQSAQVTDDAR